MILNIKKKRNVIILTFCMVTSFIIYQLYFFFTITSETSNTNKISPVLDSDKLKETFHLRSEADKFINENGLIRGVNQQNMVKYRPGSKNEFKCLKSNERIVFERVNDDYCDCEDGTDEPSTNACPNGVFYCEMQYQNQLSSIHTIPSSKVNDGICDCCDGSDEWTYNSNKKLLTQGSLKLFRHYADTCPNIC